MKPMIIKHQLLTVLLTLCIMAALFAGSSMAQPFPAEGVYDFYIFSEPVGLTSFTSCVDDTILSIASHTELHFADYDLELDSETQVNANTQRMIAFSYNGVERELTEIEGTMRVNGDTISGTVVKNGDQFPSKKIGDINNTVFFENYVAEHEILLARQFLASGEDFKDIQLFYPTDFMFTGTIMSIVSDIELETGNGPVLCTKIAISLEGGSTFFSYIANEINVPIYLDFPSINAEFFYREYYGDKVNPKYTRPKQ